MCFWTFWCHRSPFFSAFSNLEQEFNLFANMHFASVFRLKLSNVFWSKLEQGYNIFGNKFQQMFSAGIFQIEKNKPAFFASTGPWKGPLSQQVCTDSWSKSNWSERIGKDSQSEPNWLETWDHHWHHHLYNWLVSNIFILRFKNVILEYLFDDMFALHFVRIQS